MSKQLQLSNSVGDYRLFEENDSKQVVPKTARNHTKIDLNTNSTSSTGTIKKRRPTSRQQKIGTDIKLSSAKGEIGKNQKKLKPTIEKNNIKNLEYISVKKITLARSGSAQMDEVAIKKKPSL